MIVYAETNFLVGYATGRDPRAMDLLRVPADRLRIAIPSVCVMEATSWFERERKRRNELETRMRREIGELTRAAGSETSAALLRHIRGSVAASADLTRETGARLGLMLHTMTGFLHPADTRAAELIALTPEMACPNYLGRNMKEPTDELVLISIVEHARTEPDERKVLLTGNTRDFDQPHVQELLRGVGIEKTFARTEALLGWFASSQD